MLEAELTPGHSAAGRLQKLKKSDDLIVIQTRDHVTLTLPAFKEITYRYKEQEWTLEICRHLRPNGSANTVIFLRIFYCLFQTLYWLHKNLMNVK
jgi:hypothetical protein